MGSKRRPKHKTPFRFFRRPSSLWTKIFLWFCIYIVTVFIVGIWISITSTEFSAQKRAAKKTTDRALLFYGETLVEKMENEDKVSAVSLLGRVQEASHMDVFLFDSHGKELLGRTPFGTEATTLKEVEEYRGDDCHSHKIHMIRITGDSGKEYLIVGRTEHRFINKILSKYTISRLIIFLAIAVGFSYLLARYLTTPIRNLKAATQRLAAGDLSTRIGLGKGRRRDELTELAMDFDRMAEKIEMLEETRRAFLSDISHELRSPLARLNIAAEMAKKQQHPDISQFLDRIDLESQRLNQIISRLLEFARKNTMVAADHPALFNLNRLFEEILKDANFEAKSRDCTVRMVSRTDIDVRGIRHLIRSALENVVFNAIRYTRRGTSVEISLAKETKADKPWAEITVRDYGEGVPGDLLEKIFQPFFRVDTSRDRQSGGTGLGLAIAERAIRYHGGTISASNAPGGGLKVTMRIPGDYPS